jgi:hypothetical protein
MGSLRYDGGTVDFDDRLLAHLHIVIVRKLQRNEGFAMSWMDALSMGDGRSSIWLDHSIPLYFKFSGSRPPAISHDWVKALEQSADGPRGLVVTNEDGTLARSNGAHAPTH